MARRFSKTALVTVVVVAAAVRFQRSENQLRSFDALMDTGYGQLLIA